MLGALASHLYNGGSMKSCGEVRRVAMGLSAHSVRNKKYGSTS